MPEQSELFAKRADRNWPFFLKLAQERSENKYRISVYVSRVLFAPRPNNHFKYRFDDRQLRCKCN